MFGPVDGAKPFDCVDASGIDSGPAACLRAAALTETATNHHNLLSNLHGMRSPSR